MTTVAMYALLALLIVALLALFGRLRVVQQERDDARHAVYRYQQAHREVRRWFAAFEDVDTVCAWIEERAESCARLKGLGYMGGAIRVNCSIMDLRSRVEAVRGASQ